jgi:hypothetical protein
MMTLQEAKNNVATNLPVPISEPDHLKPFSNWDDLQRCYHLHYEVKGLIKLTDLAAELYATERLREYKDKLKEKINELYRPGLEPDFLYGLDCALEIIEPIEEAHGESHCDEDDLRRITIAANVITFLTEYIHGLSSGRKRDSIDIALINAGDQFKNLTRKQP